MTSTFQFRSTIFCKKIRVLLEETNVCTLSEPNLAHNTKLYQTTEGNYIISHKLLKIPSYFLKRKPINTINLKRLHILTK